MLVGLVVLIWVNSPTEQRRRSVVGDLQPGDSTARVVELMGPPPLRCPSASLDHLEQAFPPGWPAASIQAALQELGEETGERWVYPISGRRQPGCAPHEGQTEIGVGRDGTVEWFVAVLGKTPLRLPDRYSPAEPEGPGGS